MTSQLIHLSHHHEHTHAPAGLAAPPALLSLAHTNRLTKTGSCNESPTHGDRNFDHHTPSDWLRRSAILCNWIHQKIHLLFNHKFTTSATLLTFIHKILFLWMKNINTVAMSRSASQECSHCTIHCNCDATRLNMFIPWTCSSQLQWVSDSRSASQGYHTPSDSLQLASCRQSRCVASLGVG